MDYDSATVIFSNWASFSYPYGANFLTHFEGISSLEKGVYTLVADSVQAGSTDPVQGSLVTVRRNTDGSFGSATWVNLNDPAGIYRRAFPAPIPCTATRWSASCSAQVPRFPSRRPSTSPSSCPT